MNVPGVPVSVPVPFIHMERRPSDNEALVFESTSSSEVLEALLPLGHPDYIKSARLGLKYMTAMRELFGGDAIPD